MADSAIYRLKGMAIFDMDGTVIGLEGANGSHGRAMLRAISEVFEICEPTFEGISYHGMTDAQLILALLEKYDVLRVLDDLKMSDVLMKMARFYAEDMRDAVITALPGVTRLLAKMMENQIMPCLATGAIKDIAMFKLKRARLDPCLYVREFGDTALRRSVMIQRLLRRNKLNFWTPDDHVVLFGDTARDVEAGKECGIRTVAVATGLVPKEDLQKVGPDYLLDDLTDAGRILKIFSA